MNQKKKGGVVSFVLLAILFYFLGVVLLATEMKYLTAEPRDLYEVVTSGDKPEKGEYVTLDVDAVIDWYAETQHKINGFIPAGKEQHCIVWVDDTTFISLTVKSKKDIETVDDIINATWDYLDGDTDYMHKPVQFSGKIETIGYKVQKYWDEAMGSTGLDVKYDSDYTVYDLTIDTTESKGKTIVLFVVMLVIGTVFVIAAIASGKSNKATKAAATNIPNSYNYSVNGQTMNNQNMYGQDQYSQNAYGQNTYDPNSYNQNNYQGPYNGQ